jgi:two-component system, LytTR family, response regulator
MEMKAIIVDDEERGIIALQQLLQMYCTGIVVAGTATNIKDAENKIREMQPDIVFLDIEMPGGNGFRLLERFDNITFDIIFVTAYNNYAIKAIKFAALDYILKPVKDTELQEAVEKVIKNKAKKESEKYRFLKETFSKSNTFNKIVLQSTEEYHLVKLEDIVYCKASDNYTYFHMNDGRHYIVSKQLKDYEEILVPHNFFRIHKTYLININHVEKISKADGLSVIMTNRDELPVSFRKKDEFIERIKSL